MRTGKIRQRFLPFLCAKKKPYRRKIEKNGRFRKVNLQKVRETGLFFLRSLEKVT